MLIFLRGDNSIIFGGDGILDFRDSLVLRILEPSWLEKRSRALFLKSVGLDIDVLL